MIAPYMDAEPNREAELFQAALKLNDPERVIFLNGACHGDAALRQRLEALLAARDQSDAMLATQAEAARPTIKLEFADAPLDEAVGQTLGRYKLLEKVGEGGCGVVYVAEQTEPVRRRVALKVIKLGMDTKAVVARFEAERQALAMMDHPNIARVLDAGTTETGRPYFVMELVRGIRITDYCDQANLTARQRIELFIKVCQAIQHAHQKGIIHRDIKPSNILVTLHDGVPVPKVIDFGIAKATEGRLTDATVYTQLHQFIGTPAYMSPEQAEMSGLDIDTRSDIYSLGVLLYELLAGGTPFDAKELMAAGIDAMRKTIREQEPMRPSTRLATLKGEDLTTTAKRRSCDAPKLINLVKGDLDWIVMKCLEKDRVRRYETANGLAADLQRHLHNEPVLARPPSNAYRFQKLVRRNKLAVGAAAAVAMSLILGLGVSSFLFIREKEARANEAGMFVREKEARRQAEDAKKQAQADAARAEAASLELKTTLAASEFVQGSRLLSDGYRSDGLAYLARSVSDNPANEAPAIRLASLLAAHYWIAPAGSSKPANAAQSTPEDNRRVTAPVDGLVREWDAQSGQPLTVPLRPGGPVTSAQFSPDGKRIVTVSGDRPNRTVQLWDAREGQRLTQPFQFGTNLILAQFSPDGKRILTGSDDNTARVWDAQSGRALTEPLKLDGQLASAQFSPDGARIVTVCSSNTARVWDARSGQPMARPMQLGSTTVNKSNEPGIDANRIMGAYLGRVISARFSPDGKQIVTAWADAARIWDAQSGQPLTGPLKHGALSISAQFSPDGKRVLTVSGEGGISTARQWDAQNGQPLTEPSQYGANVISARFTPDGKRILTESMDGTARVWDAQSGKLLASPLQPDIVAILVRFSRDGERILRIGVDMERLMHPVRTGGQFNPRHMAYITRVWDARSGQPLTESLQGFMGDRDSDLFSSAQFSPDGKRLVLGALGGTAQVWDVAPSSENHPAWLAQLGEAISGQALNNQGVLQPTQLNRAEIINRLRQELDRQSNNDDWVVWGRWFLSDPFTRTTTPFSKQTVSEYIEDQIKDNTVQSLDEAARLAGDNEELLKRIAAARGPLARAQTLKRDADALVANGKFEEAIPKYSEALEILRKLNGPENPDTVSAMRNLADSYFSLGRRQEATALLQKICEINPQDTLSSLTLATWQTWFGQDADYEASRRRLVQQAEGTAEAGTAERAAKAACLRPSTDTNLLARALKLAQRAVDLGKGDSFLPWFQLALGMCEYRNGQYAAAERTLTLAEQNAGEDHDIHSIARPFLAMSLFRQHRPEAARKHFTQAEAEMPPLPQDESKPLVAGKPASHDVLICWLAYKEAKTVLDEPGAAKP